MKAQQFLAALVVIGSLSLAACVPASPLPSLNDTGWILSTLNGQAVSADSVITLIFKNDKINGTDGCNRYGGSFTLKDGKLTFGKDMVSTMMACAEPVMKQASAFTAALTQTAAYKGDGQQLTLLDATGKALATFTAQSTTLSSTAWVVTSYNNGKQAVTSVLTGTKLTAEFSADGKLSGSAGCNTYTTTYESAGKEVKIGQAAVTRKFCAEPAGVMEQETQLLKVMQGGLTFRMEGNRLELRNADGALMVSLEKAR